MGELFARGSDAIQFYAFIIRCSSSVVPIILPGVVLLYSFMRLSFDVPSSVVSGVSQEVVVFYSLTPSSPDVHLQWSRCFVKNGCALQFKGSIFLKNRHFYYPRKV